MSGTYRSNWQQRVSAPQQTGPDRRDLRLQDSRGVQARMVAASSGILRAAKYLRDHPLEFLLSTATSMGTFMAVKGLLTVAFPALGFGLAAAMVTSGVIAAGRSIGRAIKERRQRINSLYYSSVAPGAEELAAAKAISVSEIFMDGLSQSLFTGLLSGLTGSAIGYVASEFPGSSSSTMMPTDAEYRNFMEVIGAQESGSDYGNDKNPKGFMGKYQFGEPALESVGFYSFEGDPTDWSTDAKEVNDWKGSWSKEAQELGVNSIKDFLNTPAAQEIAMQKWMAVLWSEAVRLNLDDFVGQTVQDHNGKDFVVTKSGILGGSHLGGPGGVKAFLIGVPESPGSDILVSQDRYDGAKYVSDYMRDFGGHKVPFAVDNPNQLSTALGYALSSVKNYNGINFINPLPTDADYLNYTDGFGNRIHPVHGTPDFHDGLDIGAHTGLPVLATAAGEITVADEGRGIGKVVKIYHGEDIYGNKVYTRYGHLSEIDVVEGQKVYQGQEIGNVGNTGTSTASHLHYELNVGGRLVDPALCMPDVAERGVRSR